MSIPAPRYELRLSFTLILHHPAGKFHGLRRNISESGMLVASTTTRPPGAPVYFESQIFSGEAVVICTRETDEGKVLFGLKFVSFSRRDRDALHKFLEPPQHAA